MKIALVSDTTVRPLLAPLKAALASAEVEATLSAAEYALHELLDPTAAFYADPPDVVVVLSHLSEIAPELLRTRTLLGPSARVEELCDRVTDQLNGIAAAVRAQGPVVLICDLPVPDHSPLGIQDTAVPLGLRAAVRRIDEALAAHARQTPGVHLVACSAAAAAIGHARQDPKLRYLAGQEESRSMLASLADLLTRHLAALAGRTRKVLVLDLDNTLWGGVIGEDGLLGVRLGPAGRGRAFLDFQRACEDLKDRGILLALASKNNPEDALEALREHPHMVLREDAFAATQIHWEDKATSCQRIAETLNLGLDSLVFFDDNPVERAWVAEACPEVLVVDVPADAARYVQTLQTLRCFESATLSQEDTDRTSLYRANATRNAVRSASASLQDYLASLETELELGEADAKTLPRIAQLVGKSNQLNMTTRRRTESELTALAASPNHQVIWARVRDRFGDAGLVGVAVVNCETETWELDTFLLSCRVIKRGVEGAFVQGIAALAQSTGASRLTARYLATPKNAPNRYLFREVGLEVLRDDTDQVTFALELPDGHWVTPQVAAHTITHLPSSGAAA